MAAVVLSGIRKTYGELGVIENLSLDIKDGEFVSLLGPSGCGKTTLLRMIAGLEKIDSGELFIGDRRCNDIPPQKRQIAMVFQSYALFPHLSVRANILFGMKMKRTPASVMEKKLAWAVELLGLSKLESRLPRELSGGQRQRVALARAIVLDPAVLLLDEPLSNLDTALREAAIEELKRLHRSVGKTIIYVTHNQAEAMTMSDRIALLNSGHLVQYARPKVVYDHPSTVYAAQFIGSPPINILDGTIDTRGDSLGILTDAGFLEIDKERAAIVSQLNKRRVRVGIRPQHVSLAEHYAARRSSYTSVVVRTELVENLGDRSLIVGRSSSGTALRFLVTRDVEIAPDKDVEVFIDGRRLHIFDPQTEENILAPADAL